jgi:NAD(P)-dependent dehydrogenase (short-subunit alcohol dehydrogenase family)
MKIVVIGGSGLIGRKLVDRLRQRGHEAIAASPASGVDTMSGQGLAEALAGAQVVVDVANSPSFQDEAVLKFFQTSGRNILAAELGASVQHHLALSHRGVAAMPAPCSLNPLLTARRNEGDGCQLVEAAVIGRALSTRSCTGQPTSARCPRVRPIRCTTRRRAGRQP